MPIFRVTQQAIFSPLLEGIRNSTSKILDLNSAISSGKRVRKPSDDPLALRRILDFKDKIDEIEQFSSNITDSRAFISEGLDAVETVNESLIDIKEFMIKSGNIGFGPKERASFGESVDRILENIFQGANTKFLGRFIFAGAKTQTTPFESTVNGAGQITGVSYKGDRKDIEYQVGDGINLKINKPGSEVYMDNQIFSTIIKIRDAFENNDQVTINAQLDVIESMQNGAFKVIGEFGTRLNQVSLVGERNNDTKIRLEQLRSSDEDADIAKLLTDLQVEETVLQAALASGARISRVTLLNFL